MRRARITCHFTYFSYHATNPKSEQSSNFQFSMPKGKKPKLWVSSKFNFFHSVAIDWPGWWYMKKIKQLFNLKYSIIRLFFFFREPTSLQVRAGKGLGIQKIHTKRLFARWGEWIVARWQTHDILWGIYLCMLRCYCLNNLSNQRFRRALKHQPFFFPTFRLSQVSVVADCTNHPGQSNTTPFKVPECRLPDDLGLLFESQKFSDVTLTVCGREFQAHKAVLAGK